MGNDHLMAVQYLEKPYKLIRADSGGIRLSVPNIRESVYGLHLLTKDCPHKKVYTIYLNEHSSLLDRLNNNIRTKFRIPDHLNESTSDVWISWFNNVICVGKLNGPTLLRYPELNQNGNNMIGFVKFETIREDSNNIEWKVEAAPFIYPCLEQPKHVDGGELRWVQMTKGSTLPIDALIGGFEYEPLYIARAMHNGSLCPGKYLKSKQLAFIPWGQQSLPKEEFEILCGYDAVWVATVSGMIPENAFIGGYSEIRQEPLYIGRAWVEANLIVGKVHALYRNCYIPYRTGEMGINKYEILVTGNRVCRGQGSNVPCYMNMVKKPCV